MFYQTQTACRPPKGLKMPFLALVTLTFDQNIQTRLSKGPNTSLPCEFGANPFSCSKDISYKQKVTNSAKNRTLRSSLRVLVITTEPTAP